MCLNAYTKIYIKKIKNNTKIHIKKKKKPLTLIRVIGKNKNLLRERVLTIFLWKKI